MTEGPHQSLVFHSKDWQSIKMRKDLNYIITHVFFPPKLPQKDDSDDTKSAALIGQVLVALRSFQAHIPEEERPEWIACIKMVSNMLELRDHVGGLVVEKLQTTLRTMTSGGTNKASSGDEAGVITSFALIQIPSRCTFAARTRDLSSGNLQSN